MYAWCDVGAEAMPAVDWPALQTVEDKILAEHLGDGSDSHTREAGVRATVRTSAEELSDHRQCAAHRRRCGVDERSVR